MNKIIKRILLGLIIWAVPFITSFFIWDIEANGPSVSWGWFSAIMAFAWSIGFGIAAYIYFRNVKKKEAVWEGWMTGITWFLELVILDFLILVGVFAMSMTDFYPLIVTYLGTMVTSIVIGNIKK